MHVQPLQERVLSFWYLMLCADNYFFRLLVFADLMFVSLMKWMLQTLHIVMLASFLECLSFIIVQFCHDHSLNSFAVIHADWPPAIAWSHCMARRLSSYRNQGCQGWSQVRNQHLSPCCFQNVPCQKMMNIHLPSQSVVKKHEIDKVFVGRLPRSEQWNLWEHSWCGDFQWAAG